MTLAAAFEAELPFLRSEAEAIMVDTFDLRDYGEWDYVGGEDTRTFTVLFTSIGRIVTSTGASEAQAGERTVININRTLHLPSSTDPVPVGIVARRVFDGAEFRVLADVSHSHPVSRRLAVEQVLS